MYFSSLYMKNKLILFAAFGAVAMFSCKAKKTAVSECGTTTVTYTAQVKSIIDVNCASSCHSAASKADGIDLSTYEKVKSISGEARFLGAVRHLAGYTPMPIKAPKLSDADIATLTCWVKNGTAE
jgi:mono/diheme cytochrome c family protein